MQTDAARRGAALLAGQRWAALATIDDNGRPDGSMVAYALEVTHGGFLLHISRLAAHTRNLLAQPQVVLTVPEPDLGTGDPQTLARVTVKTAASVVTTSAPDYPGAKAAYLHRLPHAEPRFGFGDFMLVRLSPLEARYVGGFADAHTVQGQLLADAIRSPRG